jgi:hypothetical protein
MFLLEETKMVAVVKVLAYVTGIKVSFWGYHPLYHIQYFLDPISVTFSRTEDGSSSSLEIVVYFLPDYMVSYVRRQ